MADLCSDNRFDLIEKYKKKLIEATNIETSTEEMKMFDNILFRFWQMGWLEKLEQLEPEIIRCKECLMHGVCRFEQGLGLDGYCSQAERRTDDQSK